jgi:ribokinase
MARVTVVGSVNLDLVMRVPRLPVVGETVTDGKFSRHPGGKGANQALAARRLGATVSLVAAVGEDEIAEAALALLEEAGVDLSRCWIHESLPTGVAVILVDSHGENQIAVAPGANRSLTAAALELGSEEAIICQLEIPIETVQAAASSTTGFFCLNAAPARTVPKEVLKRADLVVVNEVEHATLGVDLSDVRGLVALTLGSAGATLYRHGRTVAKATPPRVEVVDAVGAGDCFVAALTVGLLDGLSPDLALQRAVLAGALATTVEGAQPSMPTRAQVDALIAQ